MKYLYLFGIIFSASLVSGQCLTLGADLSYVNTIVENGGVYRNETGEIVEPFPFFAEKGANMVRLRLWHTPENIIDHCGKPITSCNLNDVLRASQEVIASEMELMIAIHYGDYFNDPGNQKMPKAWLGINHETLLDSIYNYTYLVLDKLHIKNSTPSIIGVGNETTWGFIDESNNTNGWSWPGDAQKFNIAFKAIDDFNDSNGTSIKKAVHFTEKTVKWLSGEFENQDITNFDIIGISFYPHFSPDINLNELGSTIKELKDDHSKEVMIFETGFVWKINGWVDSYNNIMNDNGTVIDYPATPKGQRDYLMDLSETVYENGGSGIIYWEPAYISSNMCTKWGKGSPYENVCFFDYRDQNKALPAFDFFDFCGSTSNIYKSPKVFEVITYPNPLTNGRFMIESTNALRSWKLITMEGKILGSGELSQNESPYSIDVHLFGKGAHLLAIEFEDGTIKRRVVIL